MRTPTILRKPTKLGTRAIRRTRATLRTLSRRQLLVIGCVCAVLIAGIVTWLVWPSGEPPARERHYKDTTACLLTDDKGLNGDIAKAAWAGMQEASLATLIKVQHLAITGPQTAANGLSYFNTLGVQKCTVIIAAGPTPVAAMVEGYAQFPKIKHVAIGGDAKGKPLTTVDGDSATVIQRRVKEIVAKAA